MYKQLKPALVAVAGVLLYSSFATAQRRELDTRGGIVEGKRCYVETEAVRGPGATEVMEQQVRIVCEGPGRRRVFKDVYSMQASATGTPPWLQFTNYIGTPKQPEKLPGSRPDLPGGRQRTLYFAGPPHLKEGQPGTPALNGPHGPRSIHPLVSEEE